jgi:hypothetical protein
VSEALIADLKGALIQYPQLFERVVSALSSQAPRPAPVSTHGDGWRPIETVPKDGTRIIGFTAERCDCCDPTTSGMMVLVWDDGWVGGRENGFKLFARHSPTHWMPLPSPPTSTPQKEAGESRNEQS